MYSKLLFLLFFLTSNSFAVYFIKGEVSSRRSPFHEHKLFFSNIENGWKCDNPLGCRRGITEECQSYGIPRFRCSKCDFDLCDLCAKHETKSYLHPWHQHKLSRCYVNNGWICEGRLEKGGCQSYVNDFNQTGGMRRYRCSKCNYDLCERCMKKGLPDFVDLDDLEEKNIISSPRVNFKNIDYDQTIKTFDKGAPLEPFGLNKDFDEKPKVEEKMEIEIVFDPLEIKNENICIICYDAPRNIALVHKDTAHIICCDTCAEKLTKCPICQEEIETIIYQVNVK